MNSICIHHHLGLGDHFVCNGLVRSILERESPNFLYLPTKQHNIATVSQMYSDDKRVICLPVNTDQEVYKLPQLKIVSSFYRIGFENVRDTDWDVSFYDAASVPFSARWDRWKCNRDYDRERELEEHIGLNEEYILVHDTGSIETYDLEIESQQKNIVRIQPITNCLLDWCGVIEKAQQVHCIDSSVVHLAQSIREDGVFHKIRKSGNQSFDLRAGWRLKTYAK